MAVIKPLLGHSPEFGTNCFLAETAVVIGQFKCGDGCSFGYGRVVRGERVGRSLGYPTANVDLRRRQSAVMGIFAVRVHGIESRVLDAVASVGDRPTFNGTKPILEVHLFDFDGDLYGKYIHVDFIARLRGQQKYDRVEDLVAQMHRDADNARSILKANAA